MASERILIVEDETIVALHLERTVVSLGYEVAGRARDAAAALASARERRPDAALLDVRLAEGPDGIEVGRALRRELGVPVVFLTAHTDAATLERARTVEPAGFVVKPFTAENVKAALAMALPPRPGVSSESSGDAASPTYGMIGRSRAMRDVFEQVRAVAAVDWTVLVHGETGTGKELVARAIHAASARRDGPFVAINCAGLSESLAASQLFGHRRGAFTRAVADHRGVFEAASGGTLFLDEIGDVPAPVQASMLRVLDDRRITRLGDTVPRDVDVRLVAATHRDLSEEVRRGRFRSDLLYRIRVSTISLPPLRQRRQDVEDLAHHFLRQAAVAAGRDVRGFADEAIAELRRHDWPGNVRELVSAVGQAVLRARGNLVLPGDLPPDVGRAPATPEEEAERIRRALEASGGHRGRAAERLGISRATLYRRISDLGIR